jgi:ribosomal protein S18 acetylase RimI-like enzyme
MMGPNAGGGRIPRSGADGPDRSEDGAVAPVRTRLASPADAYVAARLHAEGIDQGFLSLLGPRFLGRLYRRICLHPGSFLIVAEEGAASGPDSVVGFVAGSTDVAGLYRSFLWRDGVAAAVPALGHLVPQWRRVLETLRHGSSEGSDTGRGAELLAIAVAGPSHGLGIGRTLVTAFLTELARREVDAAHVVVGADNRVGVALYERTGFVVARHFELHPGTVSLLMQWDRPATSGPTSPGPAAP